LIRILRITGASLTPKYQSGDYVCINTRVNKRSLKPGAIVVFQQPGYGILVKEVQEVYPDKDTCWLVGTIPESVDSREFGEVPVKNIIGKVMIHISRVK